MGFYFTFNLTILTLLIYMKISYSFHFISLLKFSNYGLHISHVKNSYNDDLNEPIISVDQEIARGL